MVLNSISQSLYSNIIPKEMNFELLDDMSYTIFGCDILDIYADRKLSDKKTIVVTDFCSDGFFWAQYLNELMSEDFKQVFEIISENKSTKLADMGCRWCIAKYEEEWFRAYVVDTSANGKEFNVFFIDYGTTAKVKQSDTRVLDIDELWLAPPLAVPFVVKDLTPQKFNKFKQFQYSNFLIKSINLIEKTCIFEVELTDMNGKSLDSIL